MAKIMYKDKNYSMGIGEEIEIDIALDNTSENPVQNKAVTNALDKKLNIVDISDWAKDSIKPSYTPDEVGADKKGSADTALNSAKEYTDTKIADLINGAPDTLDTLGEIAKAMTDNETVVTALNISIGTKADKTDLTAHINNKNNPHEVTKTQIGLGNVENKSSATIRSELTKANVTDALGYTPPTTNTTYSAASQTVSGLMSADDKKKLDGIAANANNYTYSLPTSTSSTLGGVKTGSNITNTSGTISITKDNVTSALGYTPPTTNTTYSAATTTTNGLMSKEDKAKLDGITSGANAYTHPTHTAQSSGLYKITVDSQGHVSGVTTVTKSDITGLGIPAQDTNTTYSDFVKSGTGAKSGLVPAPSTTAGTTKYLREDGTWQVPPDNNTVYTHPTTSGNKHIPSGGSSGQILRWSSDGTAAWGADNNTTYSNMTAATASAAGTSGLVPAPAAGKQTSFLRGDGTWAVPTDTTYSAVTDSANGLATPDILLKANGALQKSGGTMTGGLVAQSNANYTAAQVRNITISTSAPSGGSNGQVHLQYS